MSPCCATFRFRILFFLNSGYAGSVLSVGAGRGGVLLVCMYVWVDVNMTLCQKLAVIFWVTVSPYFFFSKKTYYFGCSIRRVINQYFEVPHSTHTVFFLRNLNVRTHGGRFLKYDAHTIRV